MGENEKNIPIPAGEVRNGYTRYAAEMLLPLLAELNGELIGVKTATTQGDIEYVHQSRVASRRIRAALPFFAGCFEQKTVQNWIRSVRNVTRSLGEARDLDVQIAFLVQFIETHTTHDALIPLFTTDSQNTMLFESELLQTDTPRQTPTSLVAPLLDDSASESHNLPDKIQGWLRERKRSSTHQHNHASQVCLQTLSFLEHPQAYNRPGLECLLLRLEQRREKIQPDVIDAVLAFEQSKTIPTLQKHLLTHLMRHRDTPYPNNIYTNAASSILYLIQSLCWYALAVPDPRKKSMHHEMRIIAKRLRYTLELCNKLYNNELSASIKKIKGLQTLLGDLHDCDVWIDFIPSFLEYEKDRALDYFGNDAFISLIRPGILFLLEDRIKERERIHTELVPYWNELLQDEFFGSLSEHVQKSGAPSPTDEPDYSLYEKEEDETRSQVQNISMQEDKDNQDIDVHHQQPLENGTTPDGSSLSSMPHNDTIVALIGDVHSNLPALRAVLTDAKERGATTIFNAGDLIGYGPYPEEVIEMLRSHDVISITGNYDQSLLTQWWMSEESSSERSDLDWDADPEDTVILQLKRRVSKWTYDALSLDSREYLKHLPEQMRTTLFGRKLLLVHGSPSSITEYITSETPKTRLSEIANSSGADIIVSGHTHMPFVKEVDQVLFINTGSVGRSEGGDPRACYALISCQAENKLVVKHIRVSYDVDEIVHKMDHYEFPELYIRAIREGRCPDLLPDTNECYQKESDGSYDTQYQEFCLQSNTFNKKQHENMYEFFEDGDSDSYNSIYSEIEDYKD
ncbi:MAG: CHAD domain-containing protein [Methanomicrobiales archaeon]|jgi:putative phosphoesterase|nr:CHAD domain-containing protein [Methanomicrobiales archaeon]